MGEPGTGVAGDENHLNSAVPRDAAALRTRGGKSLQLNRPLQTAGKSEDCKRESPEKTKESSERILLKLV